MAVTPIALITASDIIVPKDAATYVYFHGVSVEASGGEVFLRFRIGGSDGMSFYPIHLQDGESRADPPFDQGILVADDLYLEVTGGEFIVGGAVFVRTGTSLS